MQDINALAFDLTKEWCDQLIAMQITDRTAKGVYGGILCEACGYIHGRIGDAVYPMMALYARTGEEKYLTSAQLLLNWTHHNAFRNKGYLVNDSFNTWRGTTLFFVISLAETFLDYGEFIPESQRDAWMEMLLRAAHAAKIDPLFAPGSGGAGAANYPIAYPAAMALMYKVTGEDQWLQCAAAREAHVLSFITPDGWIYGESGGKFVSENGCRNIDLGYNVEESITHLALYGKIADRPQFTRVAVELLRRHAEFMLPDGAWDNTWGSRAVKWTYYGSRTSDGCLPACSLLQDEDPLFAELALRNTQLLRRMTHDHLLTGGFMYPQAGYAACAHHSFCHAKATAYLLRHPIRETTRRMSIPRESAQGVQEVREAGVTLIAKGKWRATLQNHDYRMQAGQEVTGGAITLMFHRDIGTVLVGNGVKLGIPEVTNMQIPRDMEDICQTVRLQSGEFTSQYCKNAVVTVRETEDAILYTAQGRLTDASGVQQGGYTLQYGFYANDVVSIQAQCSQDALLWLPVVCPPDQQVIRARGVLCFAAGQHLVRIGTHAQTRWAEGYEQDRIFNPTGGFCCLPLQVEVPANRRVMVNLGVE